MRQQIEVTVRLDYEAPAEWSADTIREHIMADINRLADPDSEAHVEMTGGAIITLREEAEIYGNDIAEGRSISLDSMSEETAFEPEE